jgi:hypothetical protein
MNIDLAAQILDLAVLLVETAMHKAKNPADPAVTLIGIVQKAIQAYEEHTGQPIDPSLIRAEPAL